MNINDREILFTRQVHDADRAGKHFDIRFVQGSKAYSFATKKELPEPGSSIVLFEQPVHDRTYALSDNIVIPKSSYGAGTTTLDFVRKATIEPGSKSDQMVINTGEHRFLLKKMPKFGETSWLFRNLGKEDGNRFVRKIESNAS
jgi:hypothetical protein